MRKVCAWCKQEIDPGGPDSACNDAPISHGVCLDCVPKFFSFMGKPMRDFLDEFSGPVYLVDSTGKIITANSNGLALIDKEPDEVEEKKVGYVFECQHISKNVGCGDSIHCKSCTIRNSVIKTAQTGEARLRVPAYADLHTFAKTKKTKFSISTEKVGEAVLLRIDDIS